MKKYSKSTAKKRSLKKVVLFILLLVLLMCVALGVYLLIKKDVKYEKNNTQAQFVDVNVAENSTPIIVDNVLVGGVYNKQFVSSELVYLKSKNKSDMDIDVYTKSGKKGKYHLSSLSQGSTTTVYSATTDSKLTQEYFAIASNEKENVMLREATTSQSITDKDIESVKKALGIYRLFNTSIKITECYDIHITQNDNSKLIFVTNQAGKSSGVYSAVVYVDGNGNSQLIKYSYIKDVNNASDWPVYSFKFCADLNLDGTSEIIIQETKEFEVKYDVLELKNNKFYEILSSTIK